MRLVQSIACLSAALINKSLQRTIQSGRCKISYLFIFLIFFYYSSLLYGKWILLAPEYIFIVRNKTKKSFNKLLRIVSILYFDNSLYSHEFGYLPCGVFVTGFVLCRFEKHFVMQFLFSIDLSLKMRLMKSLESRLLREDMWRETRMWYTLLQLDRRN